MLVLAAIALAAAFMAPVIALATATGQPIHAPPAATILAIVLFAGITAVIAIAITSVEIQANSKSAWRGFPFSYFVMLAVEGAYRRLNMGVTALRRRTRSLIATFGFASGDNSTTITFTAT